MTSDRGDYGAKSPAARLAVGNPKEFASMSAETYRHNAAECLEMSLAVADPEVRGLLKRMAIAQTLPSKPRTGCHSPSSDNSDSRSRRESISTD